MSDLARLERRLDQAVDRFERVEARLAAATDGAEIVRLGQEHAELKPLVEAVGEVRALRREIASLEAMARDGDAEMAALAREELDAARARLPELEQRALLLLAPKDKDESASAILEIRAGTGGEEAALFAGDLLRMYQRYVEILEYLRIFGGDGNRVDHAVGVLPSEEPRGPSVSPNLASETAGKSNIQNPQSSGGTS